MKNAESATPKFRKASWVCVLRAAARNALPSPNAFPQGRGFGGALTVACALTCAGAARAAGPALAPAAPEVDLKSKPTLYVVGYAHLDTEWRWAYPQTIREFIGDTLHKNFELFEKYPDYVFNFSGSRRYQMMREYYPAEYERLKGYVAAGKWFPCGSSVDENDANVPSAESFVRHILYGNRFFRREFGIASEEFMLPDCFGFPAALPTLLVLRVTFD